MFAARLTEGDSSSKTGHSKESNNPFVGVDFVAAYKYEQWVKLAISLVDLQPPAKMKEKLNEIKELPPSLREPFMRDFMYVAGNTQERNYRQPEPGQAASTDTRKMYEESRLEKNTDIFACS